MRRPSDNLIRLLTDLDVCGEEDVAACETAVRNLCHELPDFDSVWVDALVQNGVLTAWQAEILESETPERIRAGEYLILSSCGDWTFRAVSVQNRRHVLLRRIAGDVSAVGVRIRQWQRLLDRLDASAGSAVPSLNLPRQLVISNSTDNTTWIASAFVPGWAADELLVRGGRIPWFAVAEIGEQLLAAVEWLHQHQLTHGDIRCSNLRLRADGHAVLVSPFVKGIEQPNLTFTNQLRLQDVETIAPERIASGSEATPASDLYAVGCVLWQLLAGRAPFLSADPVRRALQGQQRDVADVRTLVPDCPDAMAQLLAGLTRRHPDLRPSTGDALRLWREQCTRKSGTSTAVRTRSLLKQLPEYRTPSAETVPRPRRRASRVPTVLASAAMVVAFAAVGVYRGVLPMPLSVAVKSLDVPTEAIAPASNITAAQEVTGPLILPEPDAAGVIVLESGRTYVGSAQKFPGVVHIETSEAGPALVQVSGDQPWRLQAAQVVMTNVQTEWVNRADHGADEQNSGLVCECDVLSLNHCVLTSRPDGGRSRALEWKARTGTGSVITITDCVFTGTGYGLWFHQPPGRCSLQNALFETQRAAMRCDLSEPGAQDITLRLRQLTVPGGISLLDAVVLNDQVGDVRVQLECSESVLLPTLGLVQFASSGHWPVSRAAVEFQLPERGNPAIVSPGMRPAVAWDSQLQHVVALNENQVRTDALLYAAPVFADPAAIEPSGESTSLYRRYQLIDYEGPKLNQQMPGIDSSRLP